MDWYLSVLRNDFGFTGRARRQEFWTFTLISGLISTVIGFAEVMIRGLPAQGAFDSTFANLYSAAVFIPTLAVSIRRLHDTGRSGLWLIVPLANFVFLCFDGDPHENGYGLDPKAEERSPRSLFQSARD